ncbi:hypothetical protein [Rickettsia endosymbiont of Cantharis rufa]
MISHSPSSKEDSSYTDFLESILKTELLAGHAPVLQLSMNSL